MTDTTTTPHTSSSLAGKIAAALSLDPEAVIVAALLDYIRRNKLQRIFNEKVTSKKELPPAKVSNGASFVEITGLEMLHGNVGRVSVRDSKIGYDFVFEMPRDSTEWKAFSQELFTAAGRILERDQDAIGVKMPLVFAGGVPTRLQHNGTKISRYMIRGAVTTAPVPAQGPAHVAATPRPDTRTAVISTLAAGLEPDEYWLTLDIKGLPPTEHLLAYNSPAFGKVMEAAAARTDVLVRSLDDLPGTRLEVVVDGGRPIRLATGELI